MLGSFLTSEYLQDQMIHFKSWQLLVKMNLEFSELCSSDTATSELKWGCSEPSSDCSPQTLPSTLALQPFHTQFST